MAAQKNRKRERKRAFLRHPLNFFIWWVAAGLGRPATAAATSTTAATFFDWIDLPAPPVTTTMYGTTLVLTVNVKFPTNFWIICTGWKDLLFCWILLVIIDVKGVDVADDKVLHHDEGPMVCSIIELAIIVQDPLHWDEDDLVQDVGLQQIFKNKN